MNAGIIAFSLFCILKSDFCIGCLSALVFHIHFEQHPSAAVPGMDSISRRPYKVLGGGVSAGGRLCHRLGGPAYRIPENCSCV
jgi:hypothetical protein